MGYCSLDKWGEETATSELILDTEPFVEAKGATPLKVDLAVEVEIALLKSEVSRYDEKDETYPLGEGVDGEERAVIKEEAGPTNDRSNNPDGSRNCGDGEFIAVAYPDDVGTIPDIKPSAKQKYHASEGIEGELGDNKEGNEKGSQQAL